MVVEVINAGLGRTGTSSFCEAMDILGYSCHHMKKLLADPTFKSTTTFYEAFLNKEEADWNKVYEGYNAAADWTAADCYKELLAINPNAKVVLTERPFEDWYKSMKNTIYLAFRTSKVLEPGNGRYEFRELSRKVILEDVLNDDDKFLNEEFMREYYQNHIDEIKRVVPKDQLYCVQLGEGWEGLCKFLGKSIPEQPYPNVNSTALFKKKFNVKDDSSATTAATDNAETPTDSVPDLTVGNA